MYSLSTRSSSFAWIVALALALAVPAAARAGGGQSGAGIAQTTIKVRDPGRGLAGAVVLRNQLARMLHETGAKPEQLRFSSGKGALQAWRSATGETYVMENRTVRDATKRTPTLRYFVFDPAGQLKALHTYRGPNGRVVERDDPRFKRQLEKILPRTMPGLRNLAVQLNDFTK